VRFFLLIYCSLARNKLASMLLKCSVMQSHECNALILNTNILKHHENQWHS